MLSITKLIVLAALIFAVWYGLRWFQRINHLAKSVEQARREAAVPPAPAKTEALVACPVCGTYVAARSPACAGCRRSPTGTCRYPRGSWRR